LLRIRQHRRVVRHHPRFDREDRHLPVRDLLVPTEQRRIDAAACRNAKLLDALDFRKEEVIRGDIVEVRRGAASSGMFAD
jgi:hypothetical protein